jgi:outer membrane protein OmpA-like peptidoglycan-associated protein
LDVFKTTRLSETDWTQWSPPVNLGKEINTAEDDYGFIVSTDGQRGYFASASRPQGFGSNDLYAVALPPEFRPQPVHLISGQVLDANLRPMAAEIHVEELPDGKPVATIETDPQTGNFFLALPLGKQYGYYVSKPGFYPIAEHLTMETRQQAQQAGPIDIELISLEDMARNNHPVRLNNLFFDTDRAELKAESYPELNRLAGILKQHPEYNAHIDGHTDNTGAEAHNQALSEHRAQAVLDYLKTQGVPAARLKATGFGKAKPVADNATEAGRLFNRRVEVRLSK